MYLTCLSFPRFLSSVLCFQHRDPVVHSLGEFLAKYLMFFGVTVNATVPIQLPAVANTSNYN